MKEYRTDLGNAQIYLMMEGLKVVIPMKTFFFFLRVLRFDLVEYKHNIILG